MMNVASATDGVTGQTRRETGETAAGRRGGDEMKIEMGAGRDMTWREVREKRSDEGWEKARRAQGEA